MFFEFQLAERLSMTVGELRRRMTHHEFQEWKAYTMHANRRQAEALEAAAAESKRGG